MKIFNIWGPAMALISLLGADGGEEVDVTRLRQELGKCQDKLLKHTMDSLAEAADSKTGLLRGLFSKEESGKLEQQHLRSLATSLLSMLKLDSGASNLHHQADKKLEKDLTFTIGSQELTVLQRFVLYEEGNPKDIQAIIQSSLRVRESWFRPDLLRMGGGQSTTHMKPKYALLIMGCCVACLLVLVVYLQVRLWQLVLPVLLYIFLHVWIGEYYTAVARKEAVLAKLGPNLTNCRLERTGYVNAVADFFSGLWNDKTDPCEEYYIATMVDPFFEVSPIEVFTQIFSRMMAILGGVGSALGNFYNNLLAPLPLLWKVPILALATILAIVGILVAGRYSISSIFFTIGPGQSRKKDKPALGSCASCPSQLAHSCSQAALPAAEPVALPAAESSPALLPPYPPVADSELASAAANSTADNVPRPRQGWKFMLHN